MVKKRKPNKIPLVKRQEDLSNTEARLFRLKDAANKAAEEGDHEAFLLAEKKVMLTGIAYAVRFKSMMSKRKKKVDINHINEALLGTLSIIMELDNNWKSINGEKVQDDE